MTQPTLLIAGGAGFIGSYVNKFARQAGYRTVIIDNLSRSKQLLTPCDQFIAGDIGDTHLLDHVFSHIHIDAVLHFAAFTDVGESVKNPSIYYANNVINTHTLLQSMVKYHIKDFIFSSSAAIFGLPQSLPIDENHPCQPINPYGRSKLIVEEMLKDFDQAYGLKSCCLRYFNAAGGDPDGQILFASQRPVNLIPLVLSSIITHCPLTIYGTNYPTLDGSCIRDYIHIHDLAQAHILGLEKLWQTQKSCAYNLGNGRGYSVWEIIRTAENITGYKVPLEEGNPRPGDPPILVADSHKAWQELRWVPVYPSLEKMIQHAWQVLHHDA